jgi:hypothetical protein
MTETTPDARSTPARPSRIFSILALIGGIIGAVISPAGWGILLPIAAIILGFVGRRRERPAIRFWLTGILLGVLGLVVSVISLFFQYLAVMAVAGFSAG